MIYVFGHYELDTQLYELRYAGAPCRLEPQAFNVLAYLLAHHTPSPLAGERKLVTVLCGALANVAMLAEQCGVAAIQHVREAFFALTRQEVQHYAGHFQHLGDDAFLALFGVPVTQEDHALRAVLAAVGIHQRLHVCGTASVIQDDGELAVRLGLHTGLLLLEQRSDGAPSAATVMGEAMDVAVQLQYLAPPGTILASATTVDLLHGVIQSVPWGALSVTGQTEPLTACSLQSFDPQRVPHAGQIAHPRSNFVGREREMATLHAALAQAADGYGQVIGIVGEPGMGKSRLLHELRTSLAMQPVTLFEGHCRSYGSTRASGLKPINFWRRFTAALPKALTPLTSRRPRPCWRSWGDNSGGDPAPQGLRQRCLPSRPACDTPLYGALCLTGYCVVVPAPVGKEP